jgi:hypothetical protein
MIITLRDRFANYASDGRKAYKIVDSLFAGISEAASKEIRNFKPAGLIAGQGGNPDSQCKNLISRSGNCRRVSDE